MKRCVTGKKVYSSQEMAEDALIEAHIRFDYAQGHGPVNVYRCDDCGEFHLTSLGPVNERLQQQKDQGKIDRQKIADHWARKFKK